MHRRSEFDEYLSKKLKNPKFAQAYLESLMEGENGMNLETSLRHIVSIMGVSEFAELAHVPQPRVSEFLSKRKKVLQKTIDRFLSPFKMITVLTPKKI